MDADELIPTAEDFDIHGDLKALDKLISFYTHAPRTSRRPTPYWAPKAPTCWRQVKEPTWHWVTPLRDLLEDRTVLDCNGAFLAPLSGTQMARDALEHTGAVSMAEARQVLPGYYLINSAAWGLDKRIVSPLGQASLPAQFWAAAPTVQLLLELSEDGFWPGVTVYDSWTCAATFRMSKWAAWLKSVRLLAMSNDDEYVRQNPDAPREAALSVKRGYAKAFQLMVQEAEPGKPRKSKVFRPDWYHAVRTQHRANMWRKAWKCVNAGVPVTYMGNVDEIELPTDMVEQIIDMTMPPIRIDLTGRDLGAFKIKDPEDNDPEDNE